MYMNAYCYFLDSPVSSLDQEITYTAIKELQLFINMFSNSPRVEEANGLIDQLRAKLQRKDLDIANLYLKMRLYEAAIYSYNNILKEYADTDFKEEILFSILKANYYYAENSILSKQAERYQGTLDAYNELVFQYPETKYIKDAKNMNRIAQSKVQNGNVSVNQSDIN
jgi:outer membrane protein assembly factor BamD